MQVEASNGVRALIASTMPEVFQIIDSGVIAEGKVDDVSHTSLSYHLIEVGMSTVLTSQDSLLVTDIRR